MTNILFCQISPDTLEYSSYCAHFSRVEIKVYDMPSLLLRYQPPPAQIVIANFTESDCHTLGTLTDKGTGRRYSAVVNINTGLPVALLGTSGSGSKAIEVRPVSRRGSSVPSSRSNSRNNSIIQLLNNPFG